jgi:hypothetical protein
MNMDAINWAARGYRKSSASGSDGGGQDSGGNCVMVHRTMHGIADSKGDAVLSVPAAALVSLARSR